MSDPRKEYSEAGSDAIASSVAWSASPKPMAKSVGKGDEVLTVVAVPMAALSPCGLTVSFPSVRRSKILSALLRAPDPVNVELPVSNPFWIEVSGPWLPRSAMAASSRLWSFVSGWRISDTLRPEPPPANAVIEKRT